MKQGKESLNKRWEELIEQVQCSPTFGLERVLLRINSQICEAMERQMISRAALAQRLGVSKPWITKLLSGNRNVTLKSLVCVANALEMEFDASLLPRHVDMVETTFTFELESSLQLPALSLFNEPMDADEGMQGNTIEVTDYACAA